MNWAAGWLLRVGFGGIAAIVVGRLLEPLLAMLIMAVVVGVLVQVVFGGPRYRSHDEH